MKQSMKKDNYKIFDKLTISTELQNPEFQIARIRTQGNFKGKARNSNENHHKILADELLFLGLYDEGTPELDLYLSANANKNIPTIWLLLWRRFTNAAIGQIKRFRLSNRCGEKFLPIIKSN